MMKPGFSVIVIVYLFASGCASNRIYAKKEYFYNPSTVWSEFNYRSYDSFSNATDALRMKLNKIWTKRKKSGAYTKKSTGDAQEIVESLVPGDGSPNSGSCIGTGKGVVLLLHGLYDSPYIMKDIGHYFNDQCYHTRYLLLPGHGTVPGDLRHLDYMQWVDAVKNVVEQTKKDFDREKIIFAGFSTGAGLALNYAVDNPEEIEALFLFAPLIKLAGVRVFGSYVVEALFEYVDKHAELDTYKYESVTANSVIQANKLANSVRDKLINRKLKAPVFIVQAWNDYTLPATETVELFDSKVFGTGSVFLLYAPVEVAGFSFLICEVADKNIFLEADKVVCNSSFSYTTGGIDATIDDFSHMSLTLSPTDSHYGIEKNYRYCLQYKNRTDLRICKERTKPFVCHGERRIFSSKYMSNLCPEDETVMIRLTSNPRFEHLTSQLTYFLQRHGL